MKREQIIAEIVSDQARWTAVEPAVDDARAGTRKGTFAKRLRRRKPYLVEVNDVLSARLTESEYLTCAELDLDVNCCETCHKHYPHYEMWDITLCDGRHAWVCDPFRDVLMREIKTDNTPEREQVLVIAVDIAASFPDPVADSLHEANLAAQSDEERLQLCLKYVHHFYGRKRGDEAVEVIIRRAGELLGSAPATGAELYTDTPPALDHNQREGGSSRRPGD
jgi:hypothetical protein